MNMFMLMQQMWMSAGLPECAAMERVRTASEDSNVLVGRVMLQVLVERVKVRWDLF